MNLDNFDPRLTFLVLLNAHEESPLFLVAQDLLWRPWLPQGTASEILGPVIFGLMELGLVAVYHVKDENTTVRLDSETAKQVLNQAELWQTLEQSWHPYYELQLTDFGLEEWRANRPDLGLSLEEKQYLMFAE